MSVGDETPATPSRPTLAEVGATLRAFVLRLGADGASAATADGIVDASPAGSLTVQGEDEDEPRDLPLRGAQALAMVPAPERLQGTFGVDPQAGEVHGGLGALEGAAEATRALARTLGAPTVVLVHLPTDDGETPLAISARSGEPLVVVLGDEQYEMAAGWPPPR